MAIIRSRMRNSSADAVTLILAKGLLFKGWIPTFAGMMTASLCHVSNFMRLSQRILSLLTLTAMLFGMGQNGAIAQHAPKLPEPDMNSVSSLKRYIEKIEKEFKEKQESEKEGEKSNSPMDREETGLDYWEGWLYDLELRAYPYDRIDWEAYDRAMTHRDRMGPDFMPAALEQWQYLGPRNLPVPYRTYYGQGAIIGRVNAVAYHPTQSGVYFLGAAEGGVWKTTNSGSTWTPLSDHWPNLHVSSIAIHPTNPDIIYAGTGDFHGSRGYPIGLMKSTDGGQSWTNLGRTQFSGLHVSKVLLDPENPEIVLVSNGRSSTYWGYVWRSTNGGNSWTRVINTQAAWNDVHFGALNTSNNTRYYYATGHNYNGGEVWRSADRGVTWTKLATPITSASNIFISAIEVAPSPTDPNTVYLIAAYDRKVWKSVNAGSSWTETTNNFPTGNNNYNWSQSSYNFHMRVSTRMVSGTPTDVVYAGIIDLVQSNNGGSSWQSMGQTYTSSALTHNDQHCIAVNPQNPNETLVGNDGGVYRLTYNPSNNTWSFASLNSNLGITQFYTADFHPSNASKMIGGTQDNATPVARGDLNNWVNRGGGDGGGCAIHPTNPSIQYATAQYLSFYRTTNEWSSNAGGMSVDFGSDRVPFIGQVMMGTAQPNYLYAGTNYLWRWNEASVSWSARLGGQVLSVEGTVASIGLSPSDGNRIYTGSTRGELWMSTNGGSSWTQINSGSPSLPNRSITSITVHPTNPSKIYVTIGGTGTAHVMVCNNTQAATRVWQSLNGSGSASLPDIHTSTFAYHPERPDSVFFVGNDVGAFYSMDGGVSWRNATVPYGLPNVRVNKMKAVPGTGYLNVATYGRGMWRIPLSFVFPPGDANKDGCVNDNDLQVVVFSFGQTGSNLPGDLNQDGRVDDVDLLIVVMNFGNGC